MDLSVVGYYNNPIEANLAKGKLLSADIQCFLSDENIVRLNPLYIQAVGGIRLYVLKQDEELALELMKPDPDYVEENCCPRCGSEKVLKLTETKNIFNWIGFLVSLITITSPLYDKKTNCCQNCNLKFEKS